MSMDTEDSLKEYLTLQLRLPLMARIGPLARIFEFVATAAPGVREILTVGKVVWGGRGGRGGGGRGEGGPRRRRRQCHRPHRRSAHGAAGDQRTRAGGRHPPADRLAPPPPPRPRAPPGGGGAPPEEMPVNETIELAERLKNETVVDLASVVVNRVLPELFGRAEEEVF